jgi:hypothetical protein
MSTPARLSTSDLAKVDEAPKNVEELEPAELPPPAAAQDTHDDSEAALFTGETRDDLWRQWDTIQGRFVDEPRGSVESADSLVAETMKRLAETFAGARSALEQQWSRGSDVSTEDLRLALRRYRSFFKRLLEV